MAALVEAEPKSEDLPIDFMLHGFVDLHTMRRDYAIAFGIC